MKYSITCVLYLFLTLSFGQKFIPQIDNYNFGENQNWGIDVGTNGRIFFANNKGLTVYNGQKWDLFELPKKTIVRSVFCDDNRIYTGSYEEFGYWENDAKGNFIYYSLSSLFNSLDAIDSEEFWQILKYNNNIYFRSFGGLYIYDGKTIKKIDNSEGVSAMEVYNKELLVATPSNGIQMLKNDTLVSFYRIRASLYKNIKCLAAYRGTLFFYDNIKGGFIYNGRIFSKIDNEINSVLKENIIDNAVFLNKQKLVLGSIKNGILIYNLKENTLSSLNKKFGLNNNTVLDLKYDNGNLWVALDNGLSKVDLKSSYRYYFDLNGDLGTVYDIQFFNNKYYLASNKGIYTFDNDQLVLVKNSEGHTWNIFVINNQIYCGHNDGLYRIENDTMVNVDSSFGGVYSFTKIPNLTNSYLLCTYTGINMIRFKDGEVLITKIQGVDFPVNKIIFETETEIWATHQYKGLFKITLDKAYQKITDIKALTDDVNTNEYKTELYKIGNKILFYNSNKWFTSNKEASENSFTEIEKLKGLRCVGVEENGAWFIDNNEKSTVLYVNNSLEFQTRLIDFEISKNLVSNYEKIIVKNDSVRLFNLNEGFAKFNINSIIEEKVAKPFIDKIYSSKDTFSIKNFTELKIPYKKSKYLTFEVHTPRLFKNKMRYELSGEAIQNQLIENGEFTLQNLDYGNYTLHIYNASSNDINRNAETELHKTSLSFEVLPPWYYSNIAYIVYVLSFLSLGYIIYLQNKRKLEKEQTVLKQKYAREVKEKIHALEKENLINQIEDKKKELTNSARSVIKKNEAIILLQNELNRLKEYSPDNNRTNKILRSSKKQINIKDDWQQFEKNFTSINNNFFENLTNFYPKITTRDLKLCAYIKTGLSSKEIAPLMGISVRGVELHRYRVRKKLNVDKNEDFANFLKKI